MVEDYDFVIDVMEERKLFYVRYIFDFQIKFKIGKRSYSIIYYFDEDTPEYSWFDIFDMTERDFKYMFQTKEELCQILDFLQAIQSSPIHSYMTRECSSLSNKHTLLYLIDQNEIPSSVRM